MAVIKLSEIPNAPQQVANMTQNPQYTGDQVGGAAKADIARGFEGQMQNPQNAGLIGRATAEAGNDIISGGGNLASGMLYNAKGKNKETEAQYTANYYNAKTKLEDQYFQDINDPEKNISVMQRATHWKEVMGDNGSNILAQLPPQAQGVFGMEAIKEFHTGLATAANEAHVFMKQEQATTNLQAFQTALTGHDWGKATEIVASGVKNGSFTPEDGLRYDTSIRTNQQFQGILSSMAADKTGTLFKSVMATGESGSTMKGAPDVSAENLVKLGKAGEAAYNQNLWGNNVEQLKSKIDSKQIIDPKQLDTDPLYKDMPEPQKEAVRSRISNNRAGTAEGEVYSSAGQDLVNTYPKDKNNKSNELLERKTWILGNVPEPAASKQIDALDRKYAEMVGNGGNLKPETGVMTNAAQKVNAIFESGRLIDAKLSVLDAKIRKGTASKSELDSYLKGSAIRDSIMEKVRAAGPQNEADADKIINEATRNYRATHPKTERGGFLWLKKQGAPAPVINTTDNSNPIIKIAGSGTTFGYKGDPYMDSNTAKGIGDHDNKLSDGSVAFSREIKKQISAQGIKKGDPIILHFEDGTKIAAVNDDTTDKGLKGRVDFFNPNGPDQNPYEGKKIVGVQRG
jgi:hypothetical protein